MSEYKNMKFLVKGDNELAKAVITSLRATGHNIIGELSEDVEVIRVYSDGDFRVDLSEDFFDDSVAEEINIDWMRTKKPETIELNGKKYIKSELEEAIKRIKPVEE
jgi:hypothetical protein